MIAESRLLPITYLFVNARIRWLIPVSKTALSAALTLRMRALVGVRVVGSKRR